MVILVHRKKKQYQVWLAMDNQGITILAILNHLAVFSKFFSCILDKLIRAYSSVKITLLGLSQLSILRRQFVPSRPLEGDKWEQLRDKIFLSL